MAGPTPLALGPHAFEAHGFGLGELGRELDTSWAEVDVAGRMSALHWVGPKSETVRITGVLFPAQWGGLSTLEGLRRDGENGRPLQLVSAAGKVYGRFVVMNVGDDWNFIDHRGVPMRDSYQLTLRRYTGGGSGLSALTRLI